MAIKLLKTERISLPPVLSGGATPKRTGRAAHSATNGRNDSKRAFLRLSRSWKACRRMTERIFYLCISKSENLNTGLACFSRRIRPFLPAITRLPLPRGTTASAISMAASKTGTFMANSRTASALTLSGSTAGGIGRAAGSSSGITSRALQRLTSQETLFSTTGLPWRRAEGAFSPIRKAFPKGLLQNSRFATAPFLCKPEGRPLRAFFHFATDPSSQKIHISDVFPSKNL
jgi:hypothetical protein